jgi:outer membrane protein, multidrug efflux system
MNVRFGLIVSIALALCGCDFAPRYALPSAQLSTRFKDATPEVGSLPADQAWWRAFNDPLLDDLESQVDSANPDLAAAIAANEASQSRAQEAFAGLLPQADGIGHVSANKQSANRPLRSANQPTYYGDNLLGGRVSYEIDIWGRVRDIAQSANASAEASADALDQSRLELHAELARDYMNLRGLDDEARLISDAIQIYRSALGLTKSLLATNIATPVDVDRAQTQLSGAEAQGSDIALRRAALADAIAALVGKSASSFSIARSPRPLPSPRRPRVVPLDVLRGRPDIAEAERVTAAANFGVGAARANFFPKFTLMAIGGAQDTGFRLFNPANTLGTIGPSVDLPLFDAGLRKAELDVAKAEFTQAAENYRSTVLRALKEVQDELSALRWLAAERGQTATAAAAARQAAELSLTQYRAGVASYLEVVTAQSSALDAERLTTQLHTRELESDINLLLALGGGWTASPPPPPRAIDFTPPPVQMVKSISESRAQ